MTSEHVHTTRTCLPRSNPAATSPEDFQRNRATFQPCLGHQTRPLLSHQVHKPLAQLGRFSRSCAPQQRHRDQTVSADSNTLPHDLPHCNPSTMADLERNHMDNHPVANPDRGHPSHKECRLMAGIGRNPPQFRHHAMPHQPTFCQLTRNCPASQLPSTATGCTSAVPHTPPLVNITVYRQVFTRPGRIPTRQSQRID